MSAATPNAFPALGAAALYYAKQFGWPVFPLHSARAGKCSCGRPDCGNPGKHPRTARGFLDASTDQATIEGWWSLHPDANIGIPTGHRSRFVVVDVDPRNGGEDGLEDLRHQLPNKRIPDTVEALTGGGGRHILFAYPAHEDPAARTPCGKLATGVDFKADGGYIVAPPSVHASGRAYAWEGSSRPGEVELAPLPPEWLPTPKSRPGDDGPRGELEESFLYIAFESAGWLGASIDATRRAVRCPWAAEHTTGGGAADTSTIIFAPSVERTMGWFHCSHSHCVARTLEDVLAALPASAVAEARRRRPAPTGASSTAGAEDPNAWQGQLSRQRSGAPKPTYGNLCIILRNVFGQRLAFDEMRGAPTLDARPLGDADVGRIRESLERDFGLIQTEGNVIAGVRQIAEDRRFHPVRDYLTKLVWDEETRLSRVAPCVLGSSLPLASRMVHAWFVSAVRRALEPGCKQDHALVLVGPQGYRKSTFFAVLGGQWFSDTAMDISNRDGLLQLASSWIYEWGELEHVTSRKQASEVKAFVTSQTDTFRPPFGRGIVRHPRSSVIVGSTNEAQFLTDATGSRRFWVVKVDQKIDIELLQEWREQLWAEALHAAQHDYQAWLDDTEEAQREAAAADHQVVDPIQDAIAEWLDGRASRPSLQAWVTMGEILELGLRIEKARWDRATTTRVGYAMRRLGWEHVRKRVGDRLPWVYVPPPTPANDP